MNVALFDVDGTLVIGRSEIHFWLYLVRNGLQGPAQASAWLGFLLRSLPSNRSSTLRRNKAYLSGLTVAQIAAAAKAFVETRLVHLLYRPCVSRLNEHVMRGDTVVLLSGTLEPVAQALADHLCVQQVCATQCAQQDGRYLAALPDRHPFGPHKLTMAKTLTAALGCHLTHVFAYGDSRHDLPLLLAVGHPVAVRPDATLKAVAEEQGWDILIGDTDLRIL